MKFKTSKGHTLAGFLLGVLSWLLSSSNAINLYGENVLTALINNFWHVLLWTLAWWGFGKIRYYRIEKPQEEEKKT